MLRDRLRQQCDCRDGKATMNWADLADMPSGAKVRESRALTQEQAFRLFDQDLRTRTLPDEWWRAYLAVELATGLRPGEMLGMRWEDADLDAGIDGHPELQGLVLVRYCLKHEPGRDGRYRYSLGDVKTDKSLRYAGLTHAARRALIQLHKVQAADRLRLGSAHGCQLDNCGPEGLVYADASGRPVSGATTNRSFKRFCQRAGLGDDWQLREGRHTYTSVGSHNGLPVVVLADSLGHINPNVTLRTYRKQLAPAHPATGAVMDQVWTVDRVYPHGVPGAE